MTHELLKSKIHNAVVTEANLHYVGSITIDQDLMEASGLVKNEKVLVVNNANGNRIETYVIVGERGSGIICLNGAAAHKFSVGDGVIIMSFTPVRQDLIEDHEPSIIFPYEDNLKWKVNEDICEDLLLEKLADNGDITERDIKEVALKMGRSVFEINKIVERIKA